jgi:hypothetical protein
MIQGSKYVKLVTALARIVQEHQISVRLAAPVTTVNLTKQPILAIV